MKKAPSSEWAWADFWRQDKGTGGGCVPRALERIDTIQTAIWESFARLLPPGARVLDLGSGGGAVLLKMSPVRPDLELIGVDSSPTLPSAPKPIVLNSGVLMEELPFASGSFDAAASQFGYEYSDTARASLEVARVMKSRGCFQFLVHRREGPIVAHNLSRRGALQWALASGSLLEKARDLVAARAHARIPTPAAFKTAPEETRRLFPMQPVAAEIATAILQIVDLGLDRPPAYATDLLQRLERKARSEIARLDDLDRAAADDDRLRQIVEELRSAGLHVNQPSDVNEAQTARPFAWLLSGSAAGGASAGCGRPSPTAAAPH